MFYTILHSCSSCIHNDEYLNTYGKKIYIKRTSKPYALRNSESEGSECSSSSSASSSSTLEGGASGGVDLTLQRLQSLHAMEKKSHATRDGCFVQSGLSKTRCKNVLTAQRCPCRCTMSLRVLIMICQAFWHLTKGCQDSLLWSLQKEAGSGKKRWAIQGNFICKDAWVAFLGIGKQRLNRCKKKFFGKDGRSLSGPGGY